MTYALLLAEIVCAGPSQAMPPRGLFGGRALGVRTDLLRG